MEEQKEIGKKEQSLLRWAKESIEVQSNCLSRMLFYWTTKVIQLGSDGIHIADKHLFMIRPEERFVYNYPRFCEVLEENQRKGLTVKDNIIMKSLF